MERGRPEAEILIRCIASDQGLNVDIAYCDVFNHCTNDVDVVVHLRSELDWKRGRHPAHGHPLRGSEDFGHAGARSKAAMFGRGASRSS